MAADTVVLAVRIPVVLQHKRSTAAEATERTRAWVSTQALAFFIAIQAWQVDESCKALAKADAEDFASAEASEALNIPGQS